MNETCYDSIQDPGGILKKQKSATTVGHPQTYEDAEARVLEVHPKQFMVRHRVGDATRD